MPPISKRGTYEALPKSAPVAGEKPRLLGSKSPSCWRRFGSSKREKPKRTLSSVLAEWGGETAVLGKADLSLLVSSHELALMKRLLEYPEIIEAAARELSPHLIAYYLKDLAGDLHTYYNAEKFLVDDEALKLARLALVSATRQVLANGLTLLGVKAPEKM